jgi:hypothetical protein
VRLAETAGEHNHEENEQYENYTSGRKETADVSAAFVSWINIVHLYCPPFTVHEGH